ncbi:hypothetical protein BH09PAT2_BH09PAT2_07820 [soil metagenome]
MTDTKPSYGSIDSVNLNSDNKNPKHGYRMVLITVVVLLVAIGGILVSQRENLQQILKGTKPAAVTPKYPVTTGTTASPIEIPSSKIADRQVPWLEVSSADGTKLAVGETKTLYIKGTTGDRDVTGYDMLIAYDTSKIEVQSITSALTDYQIFKFDRGNHTTVTGIKNFQKREPIMFNNVNILQVVVKAKQQGKTVVSLHKNDGQEKTQIVDSEVKVIEPQIGSLELTIQ